MKNKYKVGDKLYFGRYAEDDIVIEEYEVTNVYNNELELRNTTNDILALMRYSWLKDIKHFDTYEKAYHHKVNITLTNLLTDLTDAKKEVCVLKAKIEKFKDKYWKGELTMDMIVLNLPKAEEVLNVKKEYEDKQLKRWEEFQVNCEARVKEYIKEHLQEWFIVCIEQMKKQKMTYTTYDVPIPCDVIWENIRTYKSGYSHDNRVESYDYKGRQITFEVLDDILKEFNKQKERTHYTSSIYDFYYIKGNSSSALGDTKTLHFGCYNSYTIDDVFDGNFCVRINFRVCEEN